MHGKNSIRWIVFIRSESRSPSGSRRTHSLRHRPRPFRFEPLQRLSFVMFHDPSLFEISNLNLYRQRWIPFAPFHHLTSLPTRSPPQRSFFQLRRNQQPHKKSPKPTQLLTHSFPSTFSSFPQCSSALLDSLILSTMLFRSRQAKKSSRADQHARRDWRLGASKAPSGEGLGGAGEVEEGRELEKRPIGRDAGRGVMIG